MTGIATGTVNIAKIAVGTVNIVKVSVGTVQVFPAVPSGVPVALQGGSLAVTSYDNAGSNCEVTFKPSSLITTSWFAVDVDNNIIDTAWWTAAPDQTYQIYATVVDTNDPAANTGTFGTWLSLTSDRSFGTTKGVGNGANSVQFTITIRRLSDSVVVSGPSPIYQLSAVNFRYPPQ